MPREPFKRDPRSWQGAPEGTGGVVSQYGGSVKYQLAALDSIEKRAKKLNGNPALIDAKLQSLEHGTE